MTIGDDSNLQYGPDPQDPKHIELDLHTEVPPAPIILVSDDGTVRPRPGSS